LIRAIRDAAIGYFAEHGFTSTTVRAIAAKAEVSPALVIHHFGPKENLARPATRTSPIGSTSWPARAPRI
jgi:hypothetical protein